MSLTICTIPAVSYAHANNQTTTNIYLDKTFSSPNLAPIKFNGIVSFSWIQLSSVLNVKNEWIDSYKEITRYDNNLNTFIKDNLIISAKEASCSYSLTRRPTDDLATALLYGIDYKIKGECEGSMEELTISNSAFKDDNKTQKNIVTLYIDNKPVAESKSGTLEYGFSNQNINGINTTKNKPIIAVNTYLEELLKSTSFWSLPLILLIIFLIGGLHSLEGGHNKVILGSLVLEKRVTLKQSIKFTIIFTLTHMSDILIISLALLLLNKYIDIYKLLPNITMLTVLILIILSTYSILKELRHLFFNHKVAHQHSQHHHKSDKETSYNKEIMIAFVSGLAPCLTGWTIFMLLFSTGKIAIILPGMIMFGLGVFTTLIIYTFILQKSKTILYKKVGWIGKYSILISQSLILVSALVLLSAVF